MLLFEKRLILGEDIQKAVQAAEITGRRFVNSSTDRALASYRPKTVTYWVEYSKSGDGYTIHTAYSHRIGIRTGGGMNEAPKAFVDSGGWSCNLCHVPLETQTVRLQYMQSIFKIDLPVCPGCSSILVSEELATGKMADAEQLLEDK